MSQLPFRFPFRLGIVLTVLFLAGCANNTTRHTSTSVVDYLYPDKNHPVEKEAIPRLSLPLRVGVAFVPENSQFNQNFTEQNKTQLLAEVSKHFEQQNFVSSIEIIPSAYLTNGGSFKNLDQIKTMHGVDVMVLVSYDQTQFTDQGMASMAYWTLIGAYIIPGEKNDTHTMVDAVVYDIASRKMLFRAPGTSHVEARATPVNLSEELRRDSHKGFQMASKDLMVKLDQQLELFKQRVKEKPEEYQIVHRSGYIGGGSSDPVLLMFGLVIIGAMLIRRKSSV